MLHCMVIFSALLMIAGNVRAQCKRPFVGDNRILSDESNNQTFPDGSTVRFHCATGYTTASGSRKITCNGTRWTDLELQCKKKSCGDPVDIPDGMYDKPDGIVFGAIITAKCKDGYQLAALVNTKKCGVNGWEGREPVCEVVKCLPPPPINDGTFDQEYEVYKYEQAVTYSCKGGRDLVGPSVVKCSSDGTFQPPPPQCLFVSCDSPQMSNAVRIEEKSPPYKYKEFVRYQCNKGYKMDGSDLLTCTEKGWDSPPPHCAVISCSKPPAINNGLYTPQKDSYGYRETVTYSCNQGFGLTGTSTILCGDSGTFETIPQCQEAICDEPQINHGIVIEGKSKSYKYKSHVRVQCNDGYQMNGSDYLTCKEMGWNPPPPQCNINHQCWRIPLIVVPVLIILIVVGVALLWWIKSRKCKECKAPSNPGDCSLVNMSSSALKTEEA